MCPEFWKLETALPLAQPRRQAAYIL